MLRIALLGRYSIQGEQIIGESKLTNIARSLLAYLLLNRHRIHTRDALANLFWEDFSQKRAHNCLNTTVWRLRRFLEPSGIQPGTYLICTPLGELGFNEKSDYWLDVDVFDNQVLKLMAVPPEQAGNEEISRLEKATGLYLGDLLEGNYSDWALRERERLRCCYLDCLYYLMRFFSHSEEIPKALTYGQKILGIDPLREDVHRHMMRLYMRKGQRSLAVKQYNICFESLQAELGIPPMPETQELFLRITENHKAAAGDTLPAPWEVHQAISNLHSAMDKAFLAQQNLEKVLEQIYKTCPHDTTLM